MCAGQNKLDGHELRMCCSLRFSFLPQATIRLIIIPWTWWIQICWRREQTICRSTKKKISQSFHFPLYIPWDIPLFYCFPLCPGHLLHLKHSYCRLFSSASRISWVTNWRLALLSADDHHVRLVQPNSWRPSCTAPTIWPFPSSFDSQVVYSVLLHLVNLWVSCIIELWWPWTPP